MVARDSWLAWKRSKDERLEKIFGLGVHRRRERIFVDRFVNLLAHRVRRDANITKTDLQTIIIRAASYAGYKRPDSGSKVFRRPRIKNAINAEVERLLSRQGGVSLALPTSGERLD